MSSGSFSNAIWTPIHHLLGRSHEVGTGFRAFPLPGHRPAQEDLDRFLPPILGIATPLPTVVPPGAPHGRSGHIAATANAGHRQGMARGARPLPWRAVRTGVGGPAVARQLPRVRHRYLSPLKALFWPGWLIPTQWLALGLMAPATFHIRAWASFEYFESGPRPFAAIADTETSANSTAARISGPRRRASTDLVRAQPVLASRRRESRWWSAGSPTLSRIGRH